MADELEKTCENCKYEYEDMESTHCRHCIHNAEEHFEPKEVELSEEEIRAKAIDEFTERMKAELQGEHWTQFCTMRTMIDKIAEQMKAGGNNE